MRRALLVLQELIRAADHIGEALVPYYRQLLPVMHVFKKQSVCLPLPPPATPNTCSHALCPAIAENLGDKIDYAQQKKTNMGALVEETIELMEQYGGEDAFSEW